MSPFLQSSLDLSEFAKAAKKKLQSVRRVLLLSGPKGRFCVCSRRKKVTGTLGDGSFLGFLNFQLSNHQFEELAMDVYDEVDRRETDAGGTLASVCRHPRSMPMM